MFDAVIANVSSLNVLPWLGMSCIPTLGWLYLYINVCLMLHLVSPQISIYCCYSWVSPSTYHPMWSWWRFPHHSTSIAASKVDGKTQVPLIVRYKMTRWYKYPQIQWLHDFIMFPKEMFSQLESTPWGKNPPVLNPERRQPFLEQRLWPSTPETVRSHSVPHRPLLRRALARHPRHGFTRGGYRHLGANWLVHSRVLN